jgi:DNA gyrase subunit A
MRAGQPFAMRYPLIEVEGNGGNLMETGNWAAPRYSSARLSNFSVKLFEDIDKDTIEEWRDNYDDTEKYPMVLPSKGFYNIVNGTQGIGIGASSSAPQFNISDVNKALEVLLLNPNASFEEIYCQPDFATGAYLINEDEVKEALKYGSKGNAKDNNAEGASCKLRAKIDYNSKENCLVVTEIPYGVYTNTICGQLESILDDDEINPGIDRFNDLTGENVLIKIYLKKGINPDRVIKFLYKNTSLQYHFSINMTMLDQGRFPKVFTWKEALQSHIDHEKEVYINGFKFDLNKIEYRIHIINGLLICLASIEEVIHEIKTSNSTAEASNRLRSKFLLDEAQTKAVLDMKLSRLAHLEVKKLEDEKTELDNKATEIKAILNDENLLNQELIKGWREVAKKYGDSHRTKIITVSEESTEDKEIEEIVSEDVVVILSQSGDIKRVPASNFKIQKRNGKGVKTEEDAILDSISTNTIDTLMFFTNTGKMYKMLVDDVPVGTNSSKGVKLSTIIELDNDEYVVAMTSLHRKHKPQFVVFFTKKGLIKKSNLEEYTKIKRGKGTAAIKFKDDDSLANVIFMDNEEVLVITKQGMSIHFGTEDIAAIGRVTSGVQAIKLAENDEVVIGLPIHKSTDNIAIFTTKGMGKQCSLDELPYQNRGGKGITIYKPSTVTGTIVGAAMIDKDDNILLVGKPSSICISTKDIPLLLRTGQGNIMLKGTVNSVVKL